MCKSQFDKDMDRFKIVLETRNFEIELFWKRCNYFLVLNTALAVGVFAFFGGGYTVSPFVLPLICVVGIFVCLAWIQVGLGSKFWQKHWEWVVEQTQKNIGFEQGGCNDGTRRKDYFSQDGAHDRVANYLKMDEKAKEDAKKKGKEIPLISFALKMLPLSLQFLFGFKEAEKEHNKFVLRKPSVSDWMQRTAMFFFLGWFLLLVVSLFVAVKQCTETSFPACLLPSPTPEVHKVKCSPVGECGASPHKFSPPYGEVGNKMKRNSTNSGIKTTTSINR